MFLSQFFDVGGSFLLELDEFGAKRVVIGAVGI